MDRQEAVHKLAWGARISVALAEDLYGTVVPKPVVPHCVSDWYEGNKGDFETALYQEVCKSEENYEEGGLTDFQEWLIKRKNKTFQILVNMHQFGYEVEEVTKYRVRVKAIADEENFLKRDKDENVWYFGDSSAIGILQHTRKELEANGFGWVFDCEGVEVKEVDDGND